jgi:VWFA-related protein
MFRRISLVLVACLAPRLLPAQYLSEVNPATTIDARSLRSSPVEEVLEPTIIAHVDEVNLLLSVTNRRGRLVRSLEESDLVISDNGAPPDKITSFQRQTNLPLRVALVIDASDSVRYRLAFEQRSAEAFLKRILRPKSDLAMVVSFNQQPKMVQSPTKDFHSLSDSYSQTERRNRAI